MEVVYEIQPVAMSDVDLIDAFYTILDDIDTCVVIDNAENEESIKPFLPIGKNIDVIITSRYKGWNFPSLTLATFTLADAALCLEKRLGKKISAEEVERLTKSLGGLPLAFTQATGYLMQQPNMSIATYCELFEKEQSNLLALGDPELGTVSTTLTLALNNIRQKDSQIEPVLSVAAYLSGDNLSQVLLEGFFYSKIENAIQLLSAYSILSVEGSKIKMHRLTQAVMRLIHQESGLFEEQHKEILQFILSLLNYDEKNLVDVARVSELIPHGLVLGMFENKKLSPEDLGRLWYKIGYHQEYAVGNYMQAKICFEKDLEITEKYFGKDHPSTGITLGNLSNSYGELGDHEKQRDFLLRILEITEKYFGKDHPSIGITLSNLGASYVSLGDYEKGIDFLLRALEIE